MKIFGTFFDDRTIDFMFAFYIGCQQGMVTNDVDQTWIAIGKRDDLANGPAGKNFFFGSGNLQPEGNIIFDIRMVKWADQILHGNAL